MRNLIFAVASLLAFHIHAFDLSVTSIQRTNSVVLGGNITYQLVVENRGTNAVSGAVLIDWVDPSCQIVNVQSGTPYSVIENEIAMLLPTLATDAVFFATITVRPSIGGIVTDYALVTKHVIDDNPWNDTATVETAVTGGTILLIGPTNGRVLDISVGRSVGRGCVLESSPDLVQWTPVLTNFGIPGFNVSVPIDPDLPAVFYRVRE